MDVITQQQTSTTVKKVSHADDLQLAVACIAHDEAAWTQVIALCRGLCHALTYRYGIAQEFDDLFSAFVIKLLGSGERKAGTLTKYDGSASLKTYCYFVFKHLALNHMRDTRRRSVVVETETPIEAYEHPGQGKDPVAEETSKKEISLVLHAAVADLPAKERRIVELYYFQHLTVRQIGTILGCNASTVSRTLKTIYKTLKKTLARQLGADELT